MPWQETNAEMERMEFIVAHRRDDNHVRPHEALGQKPPAKFYETSWRSFPSEIGSPEYADDRQVRRVDGTGRATWRGHDVTLGRPLAHEPVYFHEVGDERWDVYFAAHFLLTIELRGGKPRFDHEPPDPNDPARRPPPVRRP